MRTLLLASAAILMTAGAAMAQSSTMAPAPTGAAQAPAATQTPGMSPGNMAPTPPKTATGSMGSGTTDAGAMGSGATGTSTTSTPGTATSDAAPVSAAPHHKMIGYRSGMSTAAMPADASAETYLHIASMAIKHHEKSTATEALGRAETVLLNRSVPQGMIQPDTSPAVMAIEHARSAVSDGNMTEAASDTQMAMTQCHAGMEGGEAGPMGAPPGGPMSPTNQ